MIANVLRRDTARHQVRGKENKLLGWTEFHQTRLGSIRDDMDEDEGDDLAIQKVLFLG